MLLDPSMADSDALLEDLGKFLGESFKDAIVWEQRDADVLGKYVYLKYSGKELGVFLGYYGDQAGSIKSCITFFFAHPTSMAEDLGEVRRLFHKLLIRMNLRLKTRPYKSVGGKSPAIMRTLHFGQEAFNVEVSRRFFQESIDIIKTYEPLYKAVSTR